MAVSVLETIKSRANAGNTAYIVVVKLLCDDYSDLPAQSGLSGYELAQGCIAHVINENKDYMIDSSGNWHVYGGDSWTNVYTKSETDALLDDKQDELTTVQLDAVNSGITAAKLTADEATLAEVVDNGAKNHLYCDMSVIKSVNTNGTWSDNSFTHNSGVTFTINNDSSITVNGTASNVNGVFVLSTNFTIQQGDWILSGTPSGGSSASYNTSIAGVISDTGNTAHFSLATNKLVRIYVLAGTTANNLLFKPMICSKTAWDVSHKYVPYRPSWQEMYEMIQALQSN